MEKLLDGDEPTLQLLREQWKQCRVRSRKYTGVGFYTFFDVSAGSPSVGTLNFEVADVSGDVPGVAHGVGFVLFVRNGIIDSLEGFTYEGPWPAEIQDFVLKYHHSPRVVDIS